MACILIVKVSTNVFHRLKLPDSKTLVRSHGIMSFAVPGLVLDPPKVSQTVFCKAEDCGMDLIVIFLAQKGFITRCQIETFIQFS